VPFLEAGHERSDQPVRPNTAEDLRVVEDSGSKSDAEEIVDSDEGLGQRLRGEEDEQEGEEGRAAARSPKVYKPSKEEIEEHRKTHCPFRSWCRCCVKGRANNSQHRATSDKIDEDVEVPRVSMDYFFMSKEDEAASKNPLLVAIDEQTGEKYARAVGRKGLGADGEMDWLVKDIVEELKSWGHTGGANGHIILKSDAENAIVALKEAAGRLLGGRVIPEHPPKGESQSNGRAEEAGKTVRGFTRVLKEQIEENIDKELAPGDPIVQWMVRWAAMLCSRYLVGKDGRTAYERRRGRKCRVPALPFGEKVWYKELRASSERKNKFDSEWKEGLWLGHARKSNEVVIGTYDGVVRAWAIRRRSDDPWDSKLIKGMRGTPQQPDPNRPGSNIPIQVSFETSTAEPTVVTETLRKETAPRSMKIMKWMLDKHGYTEGCEGCRVKRSGMSMQRAHSEACRQRIEEEVAKDEKDRRLKEAADERFYDWAADKIEKEDHAETGAGQEDEAEEKQMSEEEKQRREEEEYEDWLFSEENRKIDGENEKLEAPTSKLEERKSQSEATAEESESKRRRIDDPDEMDIDGEHANGGVTTSCAAASRSPVVSKDMEEMHVDVITAASVVDLTGLNLSKEVDKIKALRKIEKFKPVLVIGSSECKVSNGKAEV